MTYNLSANKGAQTAAQIAALDIGLFLAPPNRGFSVPSTYAVQTGDLTGDFGGVPAGFNPTGIMEKKSGVALANEITTTPVEGYGYQESTRLIRKSRMVTLDFTFTQLGVLQLGVWWGVDFTDIVMNQTTGEVNLPIPESGLDLEYPAILVGKDGPAGAEVYSIWDSNRATVSKTGKLQMNDDGVQMLPVTMQFLFSSSLGYAIRPSFCGLGWLNGVAATAGFNPTSGVQTVTITGTPTGGTFTLTFNGQTTSGIAYNAAASAVQSALQALSTIGTGNATVTGSAGGPYTVTFAEELANMPVPEMTASAASLTGGTTPGVTVAVTTAGAY